ncbi:MAG: hypothetical protein Q8P81_00105 [Nanoarchaeota archaeon]|nr:hypothetical protein [Nanoarchaeota archaeon]
MRKRASSRNISESIQKNKKAVSPVVATVLLIIMVIVIGLIIFLWFRSFVPEQGEKFGRNLELVCNEVVFQPAYSTTNGNLTITNTGNVPIYSISIKISKDRSHSTKNMTELDDNWPPLGLRQGKTFTSIDLSSEISGAEEVLIIPILAGTSSEGDQTHTCEERQGQSLEL